MASQFQLLQGGDFRVLADNTPEAAPERSVIAAGARAVGVEIRIALGQD